MRIWLLGRFATSVGSRRIPDQHWRSRKAANLVKLLALAPGHRMHREQVENLLWPQSGAATNNLHHTMYVARKLLGLDPATSSRYLGLRSDEVTLCPQARLWTDVKAFTEAALARTTGPGTPMRARALHIAGVLADERGLYDRAEVLLDEGLSLWRSLGDSGNVATLLNSLGVVVYSTGDVDRSIALTEEALEIKPDGAVKA
jgi:tetratricopeptide (TPR) repeat protein